jgi:hypothetical protein
MRWVFSGADGWQRPSHRLCNTTRSAFRGAAGSTHRVHIRSHVWGVGGYSCGVARCQTCHDFVLVVCLLEPIIQVHFASFQMQLGLKKCLPS